MKLNGCDFPLKDFFIEIFKEQVYLVGGTIRDFLLYGRTGVKRDIDLVVTGHTYEEIEKELKPFGKTNTVGKSFAVVKFTREGRTFDISAPRKDVKRDDDSHSHKNFIIDCGPHISLEEDLKRRDFTCNSIALRLVDNQVIDPFDGIKAAAEKKIHMTGPETFFDDPLRILRCARFASVHKLAVDKTIYANSKEIKLGELSAERVTEELFRLLLESQRPSSGLQEFFKLSVLEKLFPELYALTLTMQDALFHPEQDEYGHHTVWIHTILAVDVAKKLSERFALSEEETLALLLGVLFHDVGKAITTKWEFKRGRMAVTSIFHDTRGVAIVERILKRLKIETRKHFPLKEVILSLVRYHHRVYDLYRSRREVGFKAISRLVKDMEGRDFLLILLDFADRRSREPDLLEFDDLDEISHWLLAQKEALNINRDTIKPLVMGRHLLKIGVPGGKKMGEYLDRLYEMQLDGRFHSAEEGLKLFARMKK
ncbi:MAG: CCA tRNA nucleotidyltransferase [Candidatus Aminicenantes bacterium]|nr:CCA tRNA nucleotidyltransferase [Candidatus Aminicenantes bacterium]